jgi:hypothetical protein
MKKDKIGRNDPCPCGSGKKYKNCCIVLEDEINTDDNLFTRYSQLIASVKIKLDQHYGTEIKKIRKNIQKQFSFFSTPDHFTADHETLMSDWLWFDMTDSDGETLGFDYLKNHGGYMEGPLLNCLQALTVSHLSVYEPLGMDDNMLVVKDIFTGFQTRVLLKEPLEDVDFAKDNLLMLGRLVFLPLGIVFSGMVFMLKNDAGQKEFIIQHMDYLKKVKNENKILSLLKFNAHVLYGIFDHAYFKTLLAIDDIRIISLNPDEKTDILGRLSAAADLQFVHETSGISWYKPRESRGYSRIGVHDEYLALYNDTLDDLTAMENILLSIITEPQWEIVSSRLRMQAPDPQYADIWFSFVKDRETERWFNTPHQELDNKTPAQMIKEENGRERLHTLLDNFAATVQGSNESLELIEYMRLRVENRENE